MIDTLDIQINRTSNSRINEVDLVNPAFGKVYSDHMFMADFYDGDWRDLRIVPYGDLKISPANTTLHYASTIFEGLKAHRSESGKVQLFRPRDNARRMMASAVRMCMPEVPEELFMQGLNELLKLDNAWVPNAPGTSLYVRPFQLAMDPYVGIRPSDTYSFMIITGPVGAYYSEPVRVKIETKFTRAAAGGTGFAKTGGNYAAALYPAKLAQEQGYHQLIWTDAKTHEYVEESGTMNLMFVINDTLVTAPTGDTILKGITRDSILQLARDRGMNVEERPIKVTEVIESIENGSLQEAFGAGTAATVAQIKAIGFEGTDYELPEVETRKYSNSFLKDLTDIKSGTKEDKHGGLGFLAGSHMRSAFEQKQNMIGIGMLWKYGYYDQSRGSDQSLEVKFTEKHYNFLEDTGITVSITIMGNPHVLVKAYVLKPEIFGTIPMYFLSTDVEGNDHLSRTITDRLYDANELTRISQSIVLGIGGAKVVEALGGSDIYHLNEGHGLPAFYYLKDRGVKSDSFVFTTHTPEKAGNEERDGSFLNQMGFFGRELSPGELNELTLDNGLLSYTVAALRLSKVSNAVSKLHGEVSKDMWKDFSGISDIIPITNAQNQYFWQDETILKTWEKGDAKNYQKRKRTLKHELFREVANQTGKIFDEDVLTIVWARRFAGYKRADLLLYDLDRLQNLLDDSERPIQIIWAGKPYPFDYAAIETFNRLVRFTKDQHNAAILVGYEMASGTSGMTAAMNGSVNVSTFD
ncbi:unnamed protein product, partial [Symbiodinium sp. KB8]